MHAINHRFQAHFLDSSDFRSTFLIAADLSAVALLATKAAAMAAVLVATLDAALTEALSALTVGVVTNTATVNASKPTTARVKSDILE